VRYAVIRMRDPGNQSVVGTIYFFAPEQEVPNLEKHAVPVARDLSYDEANKMTKALRVVDDVMEG